MSRRPARTPRRIACLLVGCLVVAGTGVFAAPDPFYLSRLREGIAAQERGDQREAADQLRIACFGLLDDPPSLGACLLRLGIAQAANGDRDGLRETFRRLVEGETLVGLYRAADVDAAVRSSFEAALADSLAPAVWQGTPFEPVLATRRALAELAGLSPQRQRERLAELAAAEPARALWPVRQAQLGMETGQAAEAYEAAARALALDPAQDQARCILAWAAAELGRCDEALAAPSACTQASAQGAEARLGCLVASARWTEARALLASLPAEWRERRGVQRAAAAVDEGLAEIPTPEPAGEVAEIEIPAGEEEEQDEQGEEERVAATPATAGPDTAPPVAETAAPRLDQRLGEASALLGRARSSAELDEASRLVGAILSEHPQHREANLLAGQIAYRASRWPDAVRHFSRAGGLPEQDPLLAFYYAVSLFETGDREAAAEVLEPVAARLRPTPFVRSYLERILGREEQRRGG